jgi:predicted ATPase
MTNHLRSISLQLDPGELPPGYPFSVPAIGALAGQTLSMDAPVTFLVGENGSGKSTLLEAIAAAAKSITVGSTAAASDPSLRAAQRLARELRLTWSKRTHRGFYMRAEDFFGYARAMEQARDEFAAEIESLNRDESLSDKARGLAMMPHAGQLAALRQSYGDGLDARSHGEAFLALFQARLAPDGLFILDEPEAPLSPRRQIALLAMIKDAVETRGAQFIIATHSPILMAFPGAAIYSFDDGAVREVAYEEIDHVVITRDFLSHPELFLRHL